MAQLYTKELKYLDAIRRASEKYGVPQELIMGHIKQESGFNPAAYRGEPQINDASYGLLQILLKTAKGLDPYATVEKLYTAEYSIDLGAKYMAQNLKKYGNTLDAIAAYNAGIPRKNANGEYVNSKGVTNVQHYVNQVTKYMNQYAVWLKSGHKALEVSWIDSIIPVIAIGIVIYFLLNRGESDAEGDNA